MKKLKRYLVRLEAHYYITMESTSMKAAKEEVDELYINGDLDTEVNGEWVLDERPEFNAHLHWHSTVEKVESART